MKNRLFLAILTSACMHAFAQNATPANDLSKNYCSSFATNSSYEWIQRVAIGHQGNTSGNNNGYGDFTDMTMHVETGKTYFIHLTTGRLSNSYAEHWTVYIDYNNDGDFDEPNEIVVRGTTKALDSVKLCFTIPCRAKICTTRMRVQMAYATSVIDPCAFYEFGEVEDYGLKISCGLQSVNMSEVTYTPAILNVFPNPVKGTSVSVSMDIEKQGKIIFKVSDLSGRPLLMQTFASSVAGKNLFILNDVVKLNRGVFALTAEQDGKIIGRTQLIVE